MAIFIALWPYLVTTKLRCLQKNNIGHTMVKCKEWNEKKKKTFWSVKFHQQSGRSFSLLEAGKSMIYEIVWQFMSWWACIKTSRMFFFMGWVFLLQIESAIKKPSDFTFSSPFYHKIANISTSQLLAVISFLNCECGGGEL